MEKQKKSTELALENVISGAIQIPGVKVNRNKFLAEVFSDESVPFQDILEKGPVAAGISQTRLFNLANNLILKRTSQSSVASFVAGMPGGLAMAATIPADILQFFGMALRLAQELSYMYGAGDLWTNGQVDDEKVRNQLVLYCGVMFGVSGAVSGVRVLTTQVTKTVVRKIPQKALTKTFWYPIIKKICRVLSINISKKVLAKGVEKIIPVIGGVVSGVLNFASMMPMAKRLQEAFSEASFNYTEEKYMADLRIIESYNDEEVADEEPQEIVEEPKEVAKSESTDDAFEKLKKLAQLKEQGIITEEEFAKKKASLLDEI